MDTLFIDFDGTICHDKFWRNLSENKRSLVQNIVFIENPLLVIDWMCGEHISEEVNNFASQETVFKIQTLWDTFVNDCKTMLVDQDMLHLIADLREKFHVVLIAGNMDCFDRFTIPAFKIRKLL